MEMSELLNTKAELHDEQLAQLTARIGELESLEARHLAILRGLHSLVSKLVQRIDVQAGEIEMFELLLKPIEPANTKGAS